MSTTDSITSLETWERGRRQIHTDRASIVESHVLKLNEVLRAGATFARNSQRSTERRKPLPVLCTWLLALWANPMTNKTRRAMRQFFIIVARVVSMPVDFCPAEMSVLLEVMRAIPWELSETDSDASTACTFSRHGRTQTCRVCVGRALHRSCSGTTCVRKPDPTTQNSPRVQ